MNRRLGMQKTVKLSVVLPMARSCTTRFIGTRMSSTHKNVTQGRGTQGRVATCGQWGAGTQKDMRAVRTRFIWVVLGILIVQRMC